MNLFDIFAILISLTGLFSFLNYCYLRLPTTIGVMLISLIMSLFLIILHNVGINISDHAKIILSEIDFNETLMHGMLSYLLFAGALHVNLEDLLKQKWLISLLATVGVILSTFIIGILFEDHIIISKLM